METTRVFENANSYMKPLSQQELSQANSEEFSYTMDEFNNHNIATTNHEGSTNADEIQKDVKNAERCRRYRLKLKMEEEKIHEENRRLKRERSEILQTISALQEEVNTLRGKGSLNLSLENKLLRAEIKKHKRYIEKVVKLAKMNPLDINMEENLMAMKNAIDGGVGQTLGLLYSSIVDKTWKQTQTVLEFDGTRSIHMRVRFQFLPLGSEAHNAERLNIRFDVDFSNRNPDKLFQKLWKGASEADPSKKKTAQLAGMAHVEAKTVFAKTKLSQTEEALCRSLSSTKDGRRKKIILALATKELNIYPSAFNLGSGKAALETSGAQPAKLLLTTSCNLNDELDPETKDESVERIREMSVRGRMFTQLEDRTRFIWIESIPQTEEISDLYPPLHEFICTDGRLTELGKKVLTTYFETFDDFIGKP